MSREQEKVHKYGEAAEAEGYECLPLVMETFGAYGPAAEGMVLRAMKRVANELPEGTIRTWTASNFAAFFTQRFAIALQRGNARCIRHRATRDFVIDPHVQAPTSPPTSP